MARVRNNQGHRSKILNVFMRPYLEQELTQEKEAFDQARETVKPLQDKTWELAKQIVSRHYTPNDIKMAYHLQNKFENVDTIAKDSCFHFGYQGEVESRDDNDRPIVEEKYIESHFDFKLNGNINGEETNRTNDFAYAMYRDELKGREGCNPDINIEMDNKPSNPHQTKFCDANDKALGFSSGNDNLISHARDWDKNYELDLIGREYCRDRQIPVSKAEFQTFVIWQQAKGQMIMAHYKWIKSVLTQMKFVKDVIKGYKYLDEALEFAKESDLNIDEAEIIRCNCCGLMIYNPKNAAAMLKSMKNKNQTREEKILARLKYNQQQAQK